MTVQSLQDGELPGPGMAGQGGPGRRLPVGAGLGGGLPVGVGAGDGAGVPVGMGLPAGPGLPAAGGLGAGWAFRVLPAGP